MTPRESDIYEYIKKHKPATQAEIARDTGIHKQDVSKHLKSLAKQGRVDYRPARYEVRG